MKEQNNGQYVYGIFMMLIVLSFVGIIAYFLYQMIMFSATTSNTIIVAILSLILTSFVSKWVEFINSKKLELYKTRRDIALKIIDLLGSVLRGNDSLALNLLIVENYKVKLFFDDELVQLINSFMEDSKLEIYNNIVDGLKKFI